MQSAYTPLMYTPYCAVPMQFCAKLSIVILCACTLFLSNRDWKTRRNCADKNMRTIYPWNMEERELCFLWFTRMTSPDPSWAMYVAWKWKAAGCRQTQQSKLIWHDLSCQIAKVQGSRIKDVGVGAQRPCCTSNKILLYGRNASYYLAYTAHTHEL